jgi:hypothetical protein
VFPCRVTSNPSSIACRIRGVDWLRAAVCAAAGTVASVTDSVKAVKREERRQKRPSVE